MAETRQFLKLERRLRGLADPSYRDYWSEAHRAAREGLPPPERPAPAPRKRNAATTPEAVLRAARELAWSGSRPNARALAAALGVSEASVEYAIGKLRVMGVWPVPVGPAAPVGATG